MQNHLGFATIGLNLDIKEQLLFEKNERGYWERKGREKKQRKYLKSRKGNPKIDLREKLKD